jgi:hypothetical protein
MTAEVTARAAALYAEGESLKNISNTVGATPVAIRRALRKAGHVLRSKTREKHWAALEQESGQLMCSTCLELKDPSAFSVNSNRGKTLRNREYECKECQRWRTRERAYGITKGEYQTRLQAQGGLCGICKKAWNGNEANPDLVVDHDHRTGKVRGLLCPHCNHLLGHSMDSPEVLRAAAAYLETHRAASS